ncbi:MAG TPA: 30S ribosomal protein S7 [Planctomycetota bacterium]|nr:30S ribosomal protein S7 [Planctomycetota bacterium]
MAKKFESTERFLKPDPKLKSKLASKFINGVMECGKKTLAQRIFYDAMDIVQKRFPDMDPLEAFETAINNVKPLVEVRSKRVGGASYQVPMQVPPRRQIALAFRWILEAARKRKGKPMFVRLADELSDAIKKEGSAITQRENVHRMADANKAFAHFAR